jgi:hypothetical protein
VPLNSLLPLTMLTAAGLYLEAGRGQICQHCGHKTSLLSPQLLGSPTPKSHHARPQTQPPHAPDTRPAALAKTTATALAPDPGPPRSPKPKGEMKKDGMMVVPTPTLERGEGAESPLPAPLLL